MGGVTGSCVSAWGPVWPPRTIQNLELIPRRASFDSELVLLCTWPHFRLLFILEFTRS
jgi:hypothetical protein